MSPEARSSSFAGWRIAALASVIQNLAIGTTYGGFGVSIIAIQAHFVTSRAVASLALSLVLGAVTLAAPFLGALYSRTSIRRLVMVGAGFSAFGYLLLAIVHGATAMLACYGLLVGPGIALTGTMPTNVITMNWFATRPGRALGIVNLPILIMLFPLLAVAVLQARGLAWLYAVMAGLSLLIVPTAFLLVDRPAELGQAAQGARIGEVQEARGLRPVALTTREIVSRGDFWLMVVVFGIIVGGGTLKLGHLVPLLVEQGRPLSEGSALLALSGGAGILGSLAFGLLADRYGGARVLMGNAVLQCAMWFIFLNRASLPLLVLDAVVIGACGGGVSAAQGVLINHRFGPATFGRVLGVLSLATVPFLTGMSPLAGYLHDRTGSYSTAIWLLIGASLLAACLLALFISAEARQERLEASA